MNGDVEMNAGTGRARSLLAIAAVLVGVLVLSASASAAKTVVYNNIVEPLPGNFASIGFAANSAAEYGGQVELAGTARKSPKITVAMSSWGCQEGSWTKGETCRTPKPKKKFAWPLTLNIYSVGAGGAVGTKLASVTKTFKMPYRPSTSFECTEAGDKGAWFDASAPGSEAIEKCFHGLAFTVSFHPTVSAPLPTNVIVSVAYNTSNFGEHPVTGTCQSTAAGCYYDSLNVAVIEPAEHGLTVGSDPTESQYINSGWNENYCGSSANLNTFAATGVCPAWWEGDQPAFKVEAGGM
jgi:hypothetical protein